MPDQQLIPSSVLRRMPDPIQKAHAEVETAAAALDKGRGEIARLKDEIEIAPKRDAEALAAAVAADKPAPKPSAPGLEAEAERAREAAEVLKQTLAAERNALHIVIVEHLPTCLEAGNAELTEERAKAETLVDELAAAIDSLQTEAGVLDALSQADDYRARLGGERQLRNLGKSRWGRTRGRVGSELDQLRDLIAGFETVTETEGARREREDAEREGLREQRARDRAAFAGGVYVGSGGVVR